MSLTYGFYNSLNGDRKYNAEQISKLFDGIINDGIFMSIGNSFTVTASSGMNINIGAGRAWFNHTWTDNDATMQLTLDPSELVLHRIDTIIIEINTLSEYRINSVKILKGTPSSTPVASVLINNDNVHQYPLARIYVGANVSSIIQSNITNTIGTEECPYAMGIVESSIGPLQDQIDIINEKLETTIISGTLLASNWTGSSSPFGYALSVSGVTSTSNQELFPSLSITLAQLKELQKANIIDGGQTTNTINLLAFGNAKPTIDLPIRIMLRGEK